MPLQALHLAFSWCGYCGTLLHHPVDGPPRTYVAAFVGEERHRLAEHVRRERGQPLVHRADPITLDVARSDPREHPLPAMFSCGCSHLKVEAGLCDLFNRDGTPREVVIHDDAASLPPYGIARSDLEVWHDAIAAGEDPHDALARHWGGADKGQFDGT
jgi:hypothetical protein